MGKRRIGQILVALSIGCTLLLIPQPAFPSGYSSWEEAENLGTAVNSQVTDGCPLVSRDGLRLFIASNRIGGQGGLDIWVASRASHDETWGGSANLGPAINTAANEFCPTPTRDGHGLLFVSTRPGGCGGSDIYFSRWNSGWSDPVNLDPGCTGINSPGSEASPFLIGEQLYFSSNRAGGFEADPLGADTGDDDIYVADVQADGTYGAPVLVDGLNARFNDSRPNVRRDGNEIFFDSNRPGGFGQADLWVATRKSESEPWSVQNLGPNVNSSAAEHRASLSWDGTVLYFGSTRNRSGVDEPPTSDSDIYVTTRLKTIGPAWEE